MKRRDLEKYLQRQGCKFVRHGSRHDVWTNPRTQQESSVPRHNEIPPGTAKAICGQLGIVVVRGA
jgi:predicted RNA binding protein YcfA (HicA-like mRNA interferase family)